MQPKSVIYEYLADLMGEPADTETSIERTAGNTHSSKPASPASGGMDRAQANSVDGTPQDENAAGAVDEFREKENPVTVAASPAVPDWAVDPFQVLMIRIHGVDLAVPLHRLDTIVRWNGQSISIPGQPRWQPGLFLYRQRKINLVDLSSLIMPERQATDTPPPGYLLLLGGSRWGLICDSIQRPRLLQADEVRWSRNRQIRPWSHGIIVEKLCVLLNIDALLAVLGMNDA